MICSLKIIVCVLSARSNNWIIACAVIRCDMYRRKKNWRRIEYKKFSIEYTSSHLQLCVRLQKCCSKLHYITLHCGGRNSLITQLRNTRTAERIFSRWHNFLFFFFFYFFPNSSALFWYLFSPRDSISNL